MSCYKITYCVKCGEKTGWINPVTLKMTKNKVPGLRGKCCKCLCNKSTFVSLAFYNQERQKWYVKFFELFCSFGEQSSHRGCCCVAGRAGADRRQNVVRRRFSGTHYDVLYVRGILVDSNRIVVVVYAHTTSSALSIPFLFFDKRQLPPSPIDRERCSV